MDFIVNGLNFSTEAFKELGHKISDITSNTLVSEHLYMTKNGRFFIVTNTLRLRGQFWRVQDASVRVCTVAEAYGWANQNSSEAQMQLAELCPPKSAQDLILLVDYRRGTPKHAKNYIHHVVFRVDGQDLYYIASNRPMEPMDFKTQLVSVTGVEGVEDFSEYMCLRDMYEENARAWVEDHLPPRVYAKCFGSADA